jgi:hypothetical protein
MLPLKAFLNRVQPVFPARREDEIESVRREDASERFADAR